MTLRDLAWSTTTQFHNALEQMLPHDREVLIMWHLEELSVGEIAVLLGLTEAGVKSRHRRALERMLPVLDNNIVER